MPQFAPSVQKMAVAPIIVAPAGLNCEAELFLGPNDATPVASSGIRTFLSTGSPQQVSFPVTMPASPGTYHVYVDVHAGGYLILAYQGTEDVVIAAPAPAPFSFGGVSVSVTSELSYTIAQMSVMVSNNTPYPLQGKIYAVWKWASESSDPIPQRRRHWNAIGDVNMDHIVVNLAPGASRNIVSPYRFVDRFGDTLANGPYLSGRAMLWFVDEFGGKSPVAGPV